MNIKKSTFIAMESGPRYVKPSANTIQNTICRQSQEVRGFNGEKCESNTNAYNKKIDQLV